MINDYSKMTNDKFPRLISTISSPCEVSFFSDKLSDEPLMWPRDLSLVIFE